ncbi:MAG: hypothetical protein L0216_09195 [Planctomycetales bacterium]|nr:hypothetical protein [Planctomycetales bacterium]
MGERSVNHANGHQPLGSKARRAGWRPEDYLRRFPRLVAHVICRSLGYATPICAARILRDADRGGMNGCEWIASCYGGDPVPAVRLAIRGRHHHRGYMADYGTALALVREVLAHGEPNGMLASWF